MSSENNKSETILLEKRINNNRKLPPTEDSSSLTVESIFVLILLLILFGFIISSIINIFTNRVENSPSNNDSIAVSSITSEETAEDGGVDDENNEELVATNTDDEIEQPEFYGEVVLGEEENEKADDLENAPTVVGDILQSNNESIDPDEEVTASEEQSEEPSLAGTKNIVNKDGSVIPEGEGNIFTNDPEPNNGGINTFRQNYTYSAGRGEGVTHLARRAMLDYLESENLELSPQQLIFFETNLTQNNNPMWLNPGETRTFEISELEELADRALNLSQSQLNLWNNYLSNYPLA